MSSLIIIICIILLIIGIVDAHRICPKGGLCKMKTIKYGTKFAKEKCKKCGIIRKRGYIG